MLDTVVQLGNNVCQHTELVLEENVGPALRITTKEGALTPIRMTNLDNEYDEEGGKASARKYLASCKSVDYGRVDGRPGLCLH